MPIFHQRFTGESEEDFPGPPIARRLQPGDVVEYDADEPIAHARLELVEEPPAGCVRYEHHAPGLSAVHRPDPTSADTDQHVDGEQAGETSEPKSRTRKTPPVPAASTDKE